LNDVGPEIVLPSDAPRLSWDDEFSRMTGL
jgi:hypothetical protein